VFVAHQYEVGQNSVLEIMWRRAIPLRYWSYFFPTPFRFLVWALYAYAFAGLNSRVVSAPDCDNRGPRFESHHGRLCLLRQLLRYTALGTGCAPLLRCLSPLADLRGAGLYLSNFIRGVEVLAIEVDDRANA